MIIPVRCFTCGKVTGDSWESFCTKVNQHKKNEDSSNDFINVEKVKKMAAGQALDELGFNKMCCRVIFLSHIKLI
jgi:DNA-directed RNA polymerase subunit N (RpoN/RPB10)